MVGSDAGSGVGCSSDDDEMANMSDQQFRASLDALLEDVVNDDGLVDGSGSSGVCCGVSDSGGGGAGGPTSSSSTAATTDEMPALPSMATIDGAAIAEVCATAANETGTTTTAATSTTMTATTNATGGGGMTTTTAAVVGTQQQPQQAALTTTAMAPAVATQNLQQPFPQQPQPQPQQAVQFINTSLQPGATIPPVHLMMSTAVPTASAAAAAASVSSTSPAASGPASLCLSTAVAPVGMGLFGGSNILPTQPAQPGTAVLGGTGGGGVSTVGGLASGGFTTTTMPQQALQVGNTNPVPVAATHQRPQTNAGRKQSKRKQVDTISSGKAGGGLSGIAVGSGSLIMPAGLPTCVTFGLGSGTTAMAAPAGIGTAPVSEDEGERERRRQDRNMREQMRSQQITNQIMHLGEVLKTANLQFKPDKYSTLVTVVDYIKALQSRSELLDSEHKKLIDTITKTTEIVNNQYIPAATTDDPVTLTSAAAMTTSTTSSVDNCSVASSDAGTDTGHGNSKNTDSSKNNEDTNNASNSGDVDADKPASTVDTTASVVDDGSMVFVQGIDYKSIFASCYVACGITRIDGRFMDCNKEFEEMTGYPRSELLPLECPVDTVTTTTSIGPSSSATAVTSVPSPDEATSNSDNTIINKKRKGSTTPPPRQIQAPSLQGSSTTTDEESSCNSLPPVAVSSSASATASSVTDQPSATTGSEACATNVTMAGSTATDATQSHSDSRAMSPPPPPKRNMSLFNVLGRTDMERVFVAMSEMLKNPTLGERPVNKMDDCWSDMVELCRRREERMRLSVNLVRTPHGRPRFFSCLLIPG